MQKAALGAVEGLSENKFLSLSTRAWIAQFLLNHLRISDQDTLTCGEGTRYSRDLRRLFAGVSGRRIGGHFGSVISIAGRILRLQFLEGLEMSVTRCLDDLAFFPIRFFHAVKGAGQDQDKDDSEHHKNSYDYISVHLHVPSRIVCVLSLRDQVNLIFAQS